MQVCIFTQHVSQAWHSRAHLTQQHQLYRLSSAVMSIPVHTGTVQSADPGWLQQERGTAAVPNQHLALAATPPTPSLDCTPLSTTVTCAHKVLL